MCKNVAVHPVAINLTSLHLGTAVFPYFVTSDVTAPVIDCPPDVVAEADWDADNTEVTWSVPVAVDNSPYLPLVSVVPAVVPPTIMPIGVTEVTYVAEDGNRNKAKCSFDVEVRG